MACSRTQLKAYDYIAYMYVSFCIVVRSYYIISVDFLETNWDMKLMNIIWEIGIKNKYLWIPNDLIFPIAINKFCIFHWEDRVPFWRFLIIIFLSSTSWFVGWIQESCISFDCWGCVLQKCFKSRMPYPCVKKKRKLHISTAH